MSIVLFEDDWAARLYPISLARPVYAISCGSFRLIDWLSRLELPIYGEVRTHLLEVQTADFQLAREDSAGVTGVTVLVNAGLVPSQATFRAVKSIIDAGRPGIVRHKDRVAVALFGADSELPPLPWRKEQLHKSFGLAEELPTMEHELPLLEYPHDVIRYNAKILNENLEFRIATGEYREIADGVFAAPGAHLGADSVTDTSSGPIVLDRGATIGPFCFLSGPAFLGHDAKLIEHAAIKDAVSVGHTAKIGGEVEASVIESYTNKQHHGFLGHSYLGSWINLGAGTCNSDLKNTYGAVNMEYRGERVATGMQFVGCIMGDYSKTAINTGIFTGKSIGVCSMLYGFITTNVPSFVNYARLFGQVTELPPEIMIATQQRMFQRRKVEQRPCDVQLIHDMYELTRDERQLAGEPLAL